MTPFSEEIAVSAKDASSLVERLTIWLRARALPDSGIRYQQRGFNDPPEVQLHGADATFVAEHMHGRGAEALAAALALQAEEINAGLEREKALVDDYNDALAEIERLRASCQEFLPILERQLESVNPGRAAEGSVAYQTAKARVDRMRAALNGDRP